MSLGYVAEAGTLAEEVISTIRTAQAFGTQNTLARLYDDKVDEAHQVELKKAAFHGGGLAVFFFIIYSGYALAFSFGATLINRGEGEIIFVLGYLPTNTPEIQELPGRL